MTRWKLVPLVVLAIAACGKKGEEQQQAPAQPAATDTSAMAASDTTAAMTAADTGAQATTPSRAAARPTTTSRAAPAPARQAAMPTMPAMDEPWTPTDTGTVNPGMTRDEVVAVWGAPVTERTDGAWTYLYYRNGCEVS